MIADQHGNPLPVLEITVYTPAGELTYKPEQIVGFNAGAGHVAVEINGLHRQFFGCPFSLLVDPNQRVRPVGPGSVIIGA